MVSVIALGMGDSNTFSLKWIVVLIDFWILGNFEFSSGNCTLFATDAYNVFLFALAFIISSTFIFYKLLYLALEMSLALIFCKGGSGDYSFDNNVNLFSCFISIIYLTWKCAFRTVSATLISIRLSVYLWISQWKICYLFILQPQEPFSLQVTFISHSIPQQFSTSFVV